MKLVFYLMNFIFTLSATIPSVTLVLGFDIDDTFDNQLNLYRISSDRINAISQILLIIRILLNIANGYEDNQNYLIDDRF